MRAVPEREFYNTVSVLFGTMVLVAAAAIHPPYDGHFRNISIAIAVAAPAAGSIWAWWKAARAR